MEFNGHFVYLKTLCTEYRDSLNANVLKECNLEVV